MKRKGQALVEFVLILPVLLFLLFIMIDFARVFSFQNRLETKAVDAISLFRKGKTKEEIVGILKEEQEDLTLAITYSKQKAILELQEEVSFLTPGLNLVLKTPYVIKVKRVVPYES